MPAGPNSPSNNLIVAALAAHPVLEELDLSGHQLVGEALEALLVWLAGNEKSLFKLKLSRCIVSSDGVRAVLKALANCRVLQEVDLSYCNLDKAAFAALAGLLQGTVPLTTIDASGNPEILLFQVTMLSIALKNNLLLASFLIGIPKGPCSVGKELIDRYCASNRLIRQTVQQQAGKPDERRELARLIDARLEAPHDREEHQRQLFASLAREQAILQSEGPDCAELYRIYCVRWGVGSGEPPLAAVTASRASLTRAGAASASSDRASLADLRTQFR
jgi:hypothetical protein